MKIILNVIPVPKPRMVQSDKWKTNPYDRNPNRRQRPAVTAWFAYQIELRNETRKHNFVLGDRLPFITFYLPMPKSWSRKKRAAMFEKPHQQKPDADNLEKAFLDALCADDAYIWEFAGKRKLWSEKGYIEIEIN